MGNFMEQTAAVAGSGNDPQAQHPQAKRALVRSHHIRRYKMQAELTVNGTRHRLDLDPRSTLLDTLRHDLGLTGTKKGCDHGQCGACTVLLNGRRINACLALTVMHDGDEIV